MLKYLPLKLKFGVFVLSVSLCSLTTGCASGYSQKVTASDIINFKTDCKIKNQQLAYLNSLKKSKDESTLASLEVAFFGPFAKDYGYKKNLATDNINYWINMVEGDIDSCPN